MYMVWAYKFEMMGDYENMIEVCTKAEKYIDENPTYYQELKSATFHIKKMTATRLIARLDIKQDTIDELIEALVVIGGGTVGEGLGEEKIGEADLKD